MPDTELIADPQEGQNSGRAQRAKSVRLIERRLDGKFQRVAGLVPQPAVVAGDYAKAVRAGAEVRIFCLAVVDLFLPGLILALQPIFEMNLFGSYQAQRRVVDRQFANIGGELHPWFEPV